MAGYTQADADAMGSPFVSRAWFLEVDLGDDFGVTRFHNGFGKVTVDGREWRGVTDPLGLQMVSLDAIEEPRFGVAAAVQISLSGVNKEFVRSVHVRAQEIEGNAATLYFAIFDGETEQIIGDFQSNFPGFQTAPKILWQGIGIRTVVISVVSEFEGQNYPFGGRWTFAGHQESHPGDKFFEFSGTKIEELWE